MDGSALKTTAEATETNSSRSELVHPHVPGKSRRSSKRIKLDKERRIDQERNGKSTLFDFSDPNALRAILDTVTWSKYGSAAPAIKDLCARKFLYLSVVSSSFRGQDAFQADGSTVDQKRSPDVKKVNSTSLSQPMIILDSDDEEEEIKENRFQIVPVFDVKPQRPALSYPLPHDELLKQQEELSLRSVRSRIPKLPVSTARRERKKLVVAEENDKREKPVVAEENDKGEKPVVAEEHDKGEKPVIAEENEKGEKPVVSEEKDKGTYLGLDDDLVDDNARVNNYEDDGLGDIWTQMSVAVEGIKAEAIDEFSNGDMEEDEPDCDHSYILKDDVGYVCRVCGIVEKRIESIIEVQYKKFNRSRSYHYDHRGSRDGRTESSVERIKVSSLELSLTEEILAHPRHLKQMKPHQVEGFTFLKRNLLDTENPGGCILAHAPGSGKTFMIISFMQSFLAKYPDARPLVVLPKGILSTWKKEFQRWQIENFPLLDFYSSKADGRMQQLEILKKWKDQRSILFLGYNSFARILTDNTNSDVTASCQEILINLPSIMILDEGHTPRNENTDVLHSLAKVKTPRKVVLSGTLYQNHVKEVFNILKLVRPSFMKFDTSRAIRKRIMSSVQISGVRKQLKAGGGEAAFYELVEYALQQDEDCKRKAVVIRDLREMTSRVLHYYRGDFLDELPGLVDFTVLLKLGPRQQAEINKIKREEKVKFRRTSIGSAIYIHPILRQMTDINSASGEKSVLPSDDKIDQMIERFDIREGVKAKFFMAMLGLCEAAGEKLLVFSQFLLPLKFLERLAAYKKGWAIGKEMFMISGDSSPDQREWSMDRFNDSPDARVFFGSIKACGEGISLVGASRIIILDVHLNPSVSRQAVGRAFRPGQVKKVFVYRLVAADSPEEEDHLTCFKKELIAKRWFEWNGHEGSHNFEMDEVDINESGDMFLESPCLAEDVKLLHRR